MGSAETAFRPSDFGEVSSEFLLGSVFSLNSVELCEQVL